MGAIPERIDGEKWLEQAAEGGDPFGAYLFAESVFPRDRTTGTKYYRQAAEQGVSFAQYRLGIALRDGLGVSVDRQAAYVWLLISQQAGVAQAADAVQALEAELGSANVEKGKTAARDLQAKAGLMQKMVLVALFLSHVRGRRTPCPVRRNELTRQANNTIAGCGRRCRRIVRIQAD